MIVLNSADMELLICDADMEDADMEDADMRLMICKMLICKRKNTPYHFIGMGY
jgi:hypothetical protein